MVWATLGYRVEGLGLDKNCGGLGRCVVLKGEGVAVWG